MKRSCLQHTLPDIYLTRVAGAGSIALAGSNGDVRNIDVGDAA